MLDRLGLVILLDHEIGLREALLDIALADRNVLGDVVRRVVVHDRRARLHRRERIEHRRQRLVDHLDLRQRALRGDDIFGRDRRHRLADIAHLAARHHRLVVHEHAEAVLARHVGAGDDALDALHRFGFAGIDRLDDRVRMRRAQHLQMQHVRHRHVAGIFQRAGHLAGRIEAANIGADIFAVRHFIFGERRRRQAAVLHVARQLDRVEDLLIAGAAADIAAEPLLDLLAIGERIDAQRRGRRHHHAGNAIAALAGTGLVEGLLQQRQIALPREPFDGLDLRPLRLADRHQAGLHQHAVDEHRAGAAFAGAAAVLGAGEMHVVAQEIEQPLMRLRRCARSCGR